MSNQPSPPNLFHYGRKELSQDAMICWLLKWANKEYVSVNSKLHETGKNFARALFFKHKEFVPEEISKVIVEQQVSGIDVLVTVNDKFVILIEDKTDSGRHGNQLVRYHKAILGRKIKDGVEVTKDNFFPIFLKTGNMSKAEKIEVETRIDENKDPLDPSYRVFNRKDFLEALSEVEGVSEILDNFVCYLQELEDDFNSWKHLHLEDWPCDSWPSWQAWRAWQGLYSSLEEEIEIEVEGWGYVPNQTGGFWGLWWSFEEIEGAVKYLYLQIEQKHVAFKIEVPDEFRDKRGEIRNYWYHKIMESAEKRELKVAKPERFGSGRTMTVAVYKPDVDSNNGADWRIFGGDQKLDYNATVAKLEELKQVLQLAVGSDKRK